jgi:hypothetical protein
MKSMLFSIKEPNRLEVPEYHKWRKFVEEIGNDSLKNKSVESIAFGSWLILADDAMPFLSQCLHESERNRIAYSLVFFDKEMSIIRRNPSKDI